MPFLKKKKPHAQTKQIEKKPQTTIKIKEKFYY